VGAVQHVFRRGATYWWRRRLIQKCGESGRAPVAISLQTREPLVARTFLNLIPIGSVVGIWGKLDASGSLLLHHPIYPTAQPHNSM